MILSSTVGTLGGAFNKASTYPPQLYVQNHYAPSEIPYTGFGITPKVDVGGGVAEVA